MSYPGEYGEDDTGSLPEAAFSLTCKSGKGYDADMLTIRGQSWVEFEENGVNALTREVFEGKLSQLQTVPQDDRPTGNAGGDAPAAQNTAQAPAQGGDWKAQAPMCAHGQRRAQEWTAKSGPKAGQKQYTYFCPLGREVPADQKCKPLDAITGKEWA